MPRADRGEVWLIDLGYAAKIRPCLVLNVPILDTDRALVTVIPHTTSARGTRFEVAISRPFLHRGVFDAQNPTTITQAELIRKLGNLEADELSRIETAVCT